MTTNLALRAGRDIAYHTSRMGGAVGAMAYYTGAEGEPSGQWAGKGAAALGLAGAVDPEVIHRLFQQHIGPDGENLTPGKRDARLDAEVTAWRAAHPDATPDEVAGYRKAVQARLLEEAVTAWKAAHPFASGTEVAEFRAGQMAKNSTSRPYFDFALGLVKSASVLHASLAISARSAREAGDGVAADRLQAEADDIERAVMATGRVLVQEIEKVAAYTRTGHHSATSGEWRDAAGVTAALFLQHTNHEGDPHLHLHVTVQNLVQRADGADGKYRTLDSRQLYAQRLRLAAIADRDLEVRLTALGLPMRMRADGNGAEVAGVSEEVAGKFSSRRVAMRPEVQALADEYTARHGHAPNQRALWLMKQYVSMKQRKNSRGSHASPAEMLSEWERQTTDSEIQALSEVHQSVRVAERGAAAVLDQAAKERAARIAVAEVQKHHAVFGMNELTFEVHRALPVLPEGTDAKAVIEEVARLAVSGRCGAGVVMATAPDITDVSSLGIRDSDGRSIFRPPNEDRWTTIPHLNLEERIVADATRPVPQLVTVEQARAAADATGLNAQQREALVMMLTSATATVALLAPAGAGKTRVTGEFARIWTELTGGRVIGLTTSTNAARVMASEGVPETYNLAQFLGKIEGSDELRYPVPVNPRDFLILDEATQVSTGDWALVQQVARASGARTAGVGDTRQLGAVGAGGAFRLVAQEVPATELHEVLRFREEWERAASVKLRDGDFTAYADYDRRGRMTGADHEKAFDLAVTSWLADHLAGKLSLLLAGSNLEAAELSRRAQERLVKLGAVAEPRAPLSDGNMAGTGDLIRARLNAAAIDAGGRPVTNRDTLRVSAWNGQDATVRRRELDGSWSAEFILPGSYMAENTELDYAGNTHVGQGRTVDTGHLLVSETLDRAGFYVGMTRGREGNQAHIVTGDTAPEGREPYEQAAPESVVRSVMQRDDADLSATEQIRLSQEWASGTGHLLTLWAKSVRESVTPGIDALFRERLSEAEYRRFEAEYSKDALMAALRERQLRGQDLVSLASQITAAPLDGARVISSVLHGRLAQVPMPTGEEIAQWVDRMPWAAPEMARELAEGIDARMAELGERAVAEPPLWLLDHLGVLAPDASSILRAEYTRRAGVAAAYREAAGITDTRQAISARPHLDRPELEAMRQDTIRSLEITVEELSEMSRGELEARVAEGQRATAAAPADVSSRLRMAAVAEADASRRAAEREVEHDTEGAQAARDLAALVGSARASLEADNARYEAWSDATAVIREQAGQAKAELARRGIEEAEEPRPTADWWAEFEENLAAMENALEAERLAAERDGLPWPPGRAPEASGEAEAPPAELDDPAERPPAVTWWSEFTRDMEAVEQAVEAEAEAAGQGAEPEIGPGQRDSQEPAVRPTVRWWSEFERDLDGVDRALSREREAAAAEGRPWPPERTPEQRAGSSALRELEEWSARLDVAQDRAALAAAAVAAERAQAREDAEYAARLEQEAEFAPEAKAEAEREAE